MFISCQQNEGQNHNKITTEKNLLKTWQEFKYFELTLKHHNCSHEEIKGRLNLENICYNSVQNLTPSILLSENIKITIYWTVMLLVALYGCETWCLTFREGHRLRCSRTTCWDCVGPKSKDVIGDWRKPYNENKHVGRRYIHTYTHTHTHTHTHTYTHTYIHTFPSIFFPLYLRSSSVCYREMFTTNSEIHKFGTRQHHNFQLSFCYIN